MAQLEFTKMQGSGNDFVIIDNRKYLLSLDEIIELTPRLCNRKYGIGADGLIALADADKADYEMIYRNADGSDAGMCGNGGRCIARFAFESGFKPRHSFTIHDVIYEAEVSESDNYVILKFPVTARPEFVDIPGYDKIIKIYTGTEHIVLPVEKKKLSNEKELVEKGRELRNHNVFEPLGTNVNFFCGLDEQTVELQTYERGVEDLTLACGTGALATALAWHQNQGDSRTSPTYHVETKGGRLDVPFHYDKANNIYKNLTLKGPAKFVFKGIIKL